MFIRYHIITISPLTLQNTEQQTFIPFALSLVAETTTNNNIYTLASNLDFTPQIQHAKMESCVLSHEHHGKVRFNSKPSYSYLKFVPFALQSNSETHL
jgi:hypothetical protein